MIINMQSATVIIIKLFMYGYNNIMSILKTHMENSLNNFEFKNFKCLTNAKYLIRRLNI